MLCFHDLPGITGGELLQERSTQSLYYLIIDSRKVINSPASVFFAIRGKRHNGHRFIKALYQKGIRNFVVEVAPDLEEIPEANVLQVSSSVTALQQLAAAHRNQFLLPVLGITGSNGKTIVKEWLGQCLSHDYALVKSPRSYNSQVGVPLSVWNMDDYHTLGIFEAGISRPGEMEKLQPVIQPGTGLLTNLGSAHDEGFASREEKLREKLTLFKSCHTIIYCCDDVWADGIIRREFPDRSLFTWSASGMANATVVFESIHHEGKYTYFKGRYQDIVQEFFLPFSDEASLEDAMHCIAFLFYLGVPADRIRAKVESLRAISMRLSIQQAVNSSYLIDDTYNNDLAGLRIALNFLARQKQRDRKTLILSDIPETGKEPESLYTEVAALLETLGVDRVIGVGAVISRYAHLFTMEKDFYADTGELLDALSPEMFRQEYILVKGGRSFRFEKIVQRLLQKFHRTVFQVNLDALSHNLNFFRSRLNPETRILVMVKAFAYGSGSSEVAEWLEFHQVDYLAVAYADEGVALRKNGISLPVLVLNPSEGDFDNLVEYKLEPELYCLSIYDAFVEYLERTGQRAGVHLKLDTGMNRLGFGAGELPELLNRLRDPGPLNIKSVFTHLAAADEARHEEFTHQQISTFQGWFRDVEHTLGYTPLKHILNSAGIVRYPEAQEDMVRLGIGLYGVVADEAVQKQLMPVGRLKTSVAQVKHVKSGETVGYGRKGEVATDKTIAVLVVGYSDGYDYRFGNGVGKVKIRGQWAPTIGSICMDMCMVDVTGLDVREGDEAEVFGEGFPVHEAAAKIGTIPYELLTGISERVKREFFTE